MAKLRVKSITTRKTSVRIKILLFIAVMVVVSNLILGLGTYAYSKNLIFGQIQEQARSIASCAASVTDGEELENIVDMSPEDEIVLKYSHTYKGMTSEYGADYIYIFMLNDKGEPFFAATSDIEDSSDSIGETFEMYPGMREAFGGKCAADEEETTDEWGTFLSGYAPVFNTNSQVVGIVGADINFSELQGRLDSLRTQILFMYVFISSIMIVGCIVISNLLNRGFFILNSKVEELADGSGDLNREVEIQSGDEFETIAKSINSFIGEVRLLAEIVAKEANHSADTIAQINNRVTELSANIEECSATSECISERLENTSTNVIQMAQLVENTEKKVSEAAQSAISESQNAIMQKENATAKIRRIQENVREAAQRAKAVDQVQVMATEIKRIASESRILALNAQIEAARAGEAGRGFAVVAQEMEELNEQITSAVTRISEINDTVLGSVSDLISDTNQIDEYLTDKVLPDYDEYAKLGEEYGTMAEFVYEDMGVLASQTAKLVEEVQTINLSVHDITNAVMDSANQVASVNNDSNAIVENMNRLTDTAMLRMVNK